jgi:mono/diheme cytochrome c family protein
MAADIPGVRVFVGIALLSVASQFARAEDGSLYFAKHIQPLLAKKCVSCHGPEKQKAGLRLDRKAAAFKGGEDLGAAIMPGKSRASPLFRVVAGLEEGLEMPAEGEKLTVAEIEVLKRWIDGGAEWPDDGSEKEDVLKSHWAFRPLVSGTALAASRSAQSPVASAIPLSSTAQNPIDVFIFSRLERDGLKPSSAADRTTLIRRLKFDLLGLPPSPEEVDEFVADPEPDAYERLVDRYLASPHFGERWARHWLDVVRFAESHGFEMNQPRPNAWPYRDYVIRSFNEDKPYDQFVFEQLAGDTVGADEATGFLVGGPWDQVKSPDLGLTLQQRADELHDMVSTTGSVFLGLTVGCARCHNHKFDPISQLDYYGMKACFAGVQHGERPLRTADSDDRQRRAATIREQLAVIETEILKLDPQAKRSGVVFVERFAPARAKFVRMTIHATNSAEPCIDELEVFTAGEKPENVALASRGTKAKASSSLPGFAIHKLEHVNDGRYGNSFSWISNEPGRGWVELELPREFEIDRIVWSRDRDPAQFKDRTATKYVLEISADRETWQAVATFPDSRLAALSPEDKARVEQLNTQRAALQKTLTEWSAAPMAYSGKLMPPEETFRLHRGDPLQKREPVVPTGLASFGSVWKLDANTAEAQRRVQLAKWINDPANPLTARVIANRLWHYHFGTGLVDTPSDFGLNGGKPTHPELLDWLASELSNSKSEISKLKSEISNPEQSRSSLKRLHRLIVTSATYRQASAPREAGLAADAGSRLLWRFPPRRLEAEALRDAIIATSGQLDRRMNGAGFDLFEPNANYVRVFNSKQQFVPETDFRRMVYAHKHRMQLDDTFGTFDCPDAGQVAPKRNSSNTPLQALNLLNSRFLVQQAEQFAARVRAEAAADPAVQAAAAIQRAFGRPAAPDETAAAVALMNEHGLPALCRALLNANEFLFVR